MRTWRLGALAVCANLTAALAPPESAHDYEIKAVYLYNFAQFVEWPESAFARPDTPFRIGVLGENPFRGALDKVVRGEFAHGRRIEVLYSRKLADLRSCEIIFISASEERWPETLRSLAAEPVLTVSDIPGFADRGGTIDFYAEEKKVRFEINVASAQAHELRISSQLLKLVRPKPASI